MKIKLAQKLFLVYVERRIRRDLGAGVDILRLNLRIGHVRRIGCHCLR